MELQHLHDHPLFFVEDYSEDCCASQVFCSVCEDVVTFGPIYNCSDCYFYLHKSCAELPLQWEYPLHSQHPLFLFATSPYTELSRSCICLACHQVCKSFVYHCSHCNFDLHIKCALSDPKESSIKRIGDTEQFQHFSHAHPLIFSEGEESLVCSGCERVISDPFYYDCDQCVFRLHKSCAELPLLQLLPFHPQHIFRLSFGIFGKSVCCDRCSSVSKGLSYFCNACKIKIHIACVQLSPETSWIRKGDGEMVHLSHWCSLTLEENVQKYAGEAQYCGLCQELVSSPYYDCSKCKFTIHKSCAELPSVIKCNFHLPDHSLFLFPKTPWSPNENSCKICDRGLKKFVYCCFQCNYSLDVQCSLSLSNVEEDHQHDFIMLQKLIDFSCEVCGKKDKVYPWLCTICHLFAHRECAQSPGMLRVRQHLHILNLVYSLNEVINQPDNFVCKLCYKKVDAKYAAYCCSQCKYVAHLECARMLRIVDIESPFTEENQDLLASMDLLSKKFYTFIDDFVYETQLVEEERHQKLEHFSHKHSLLLNDEKLTTKKHCDGCARPISTPYYSCGECNFYLHRTCGEIPTKIKHPLHPHPLALVLNDLSKERFEITCNGCDCPFHGFEYVCKDCDYKLDIRCASIPEELKHPLHEHLLFTPSTRQYEKCNACGYMSRYILVSPKDGEFIMDYRCATLPLIARHRYDKHVLKLTNIARINSDEYYCEICEEERDINYWYYYYEECDFSAHPRCFLGKY